MPFTISHAAVAVPLQPLARRGRLPLSALVIGAMVPDFEYFLHLRPLALWGHSLVGLATFCLPVGLAVLAAWELVVRDSVRDLAGLETRAVDTPRSGRWWALASVGILLGAGTHVLWDGMTHQGRWAERFVPALGATAIHLPDRPITWLAVLDHASTVVGGAVILVWLTKLLQPHRRALTTVHRSRWRAVVVTLLVGAATGVGLWNGSHGPAPTDYWNGELWLARVAVGAMLGLGAALLTFGAIHRLARPGTQLVLQEDDDNIGQ